MSSYIFCIDFQCMKTAKRIKIAPARMENKRNQLERSLKKSNEFWMHPHSDCVL